MQKSFVVVFAAVCCMQMVSTLPLENIQSVQEMSKTYEKVARDAENGGLSFLVVPIVFNDKKEASSGPPALFVRQADQGTPSWSNFFGFSPAAVGENVQQIMNSWFNFGVAPAAAPAKKPAETPTPSEAQDESAPAPAPVQENFFNQINQNFQQQVNSAMNAFTGFFSSAANRPADRPANDVLTTISQNAANTLPPLSSLTEKIVVEATTVKVEKVSNTIEESEKSHEEVKVEEVPPPVQPLTDKAVEPITAPVPESEKSPEEIKIEEVPVPVEPVNADQVPVIVVHEDSNTVEN